MLMSSGESLCMRLPTSSVVLKAFLGTEVAADNRLIIVVFCSKREEGCRAGTFYPTDPDVSLCYKPRAAGKMLNFGGLSDFLVSPEVGHFWILAKHVQKPDKLLVFSMVTRKHFCHRDIQLTHSYPAVWLCTKSAFHDFSGHPVNHV